ncbi:metallophosphoesterase [Paenibacillus protaetiae]|uniref:Calcineurin-like phosphoesterase domain-containing protein n=1 Tax=Paenibacillus protaetiae TaxID=2509456 RepID=A0A4P6EVB4_9BACL|nr:metallophosphoesterase [Paenibacillus protaetiae]QAY67230.1 hypothetical protein ET464_13290 [Paenibacillus protaetiae]
MTLYFAHLTDTHINKPGHNPMFNLNMTDKLRQAFEQLGKLAEKPAFVVISGDLTQDGDTDDYRHLRAVLDEESEKLGVPVHVGLGNHDSRPAFREGYLGEAPSEASYYYSVNEQGLRLIVLNTQVPGTHDGRLDEEQLEWLRGELSTPAPLGSIIVLHHPVLPTMTDAMDTHLLANPEALGEVIEGTDVIGLLSGHIHFNSIGLFHGVPSAAITGVAFGLDPTDHNGMRFIDNSGYNLVLVKQGKMIATPAYIPGEQPVVFEMSYEAMKAHAHA